MSPRFSVGNMDCDVIAAIGCGVSSARAMARGAR